MLNFAVTVAENTRFREGLLQEASWGTILVYRGISWLRAARGYRSFIDKGPIERAPRLALKQSNKQQRLFNCCLLVLLARIG